MSVSSEFPPDDSSPHEARGNDKKPRPRLPLTQHEKTAFSCLASEIGPVPIPDECLDPSMRIIRREARQLQEVLNRLPSTLDAEQRQSVAEAADHLNARYYELGVRYREIKFTGKLRFYCENDGMPKAEYEMDDEDWHDLEERLGPRQHDALGAYYQVAELPLVASPFDYLESGGDAPTDLPDWNQRFVCYTFSANDYDPDDPMMFAYIDDDPQVSLTIPSPEGELEAFELGYPDLVSQIEKLPDNSEHGANLIKALHEFRMTIDWSTDQTTEARSRLIATIERYIFEHLNFDTAEYRFLIKGHVGTLSAQYTEINTRYRLPIVRMMIIRAVHLTPEHSQPQDTSAYTLSIEALCPYPEHKGGVFPVLLPVESILRMWNTRPRRLPFKFSTMEGVICEEPGQLTEYIRPIDAGAFVMTDELENPDRDEAAATTTRITEALQIARSIEAAYEYLGAMREQMDALVAETTRLCSVEYASRESRDNASSRIFEMFTAFKAAYDARPFTIIAAGRGLFVPTHTISSVFDKDADDRLTITFDKSTVEPGDITTERMGTLQDIHITETGDGASTPLRMMASLRFLDHSQTGPVVETANDSGEITFLEVSRRSYFLANATTGMELRIRDFEEGLAREAAVIPILMKYSEGDRTPLVRVPAELFDEIRNSPPTDLILSTQLEAMQQLLSEVGDEKIEEVCRVLEVAIGQETSLLIGGSAYDQRGEASRATIMGSLYSIVPEATFVRASGPAVTLPGPIIVLSQYTGDTEKLWYMPLKSIEQLQY